MFFRLLFSAIAIKFFLKALNILNNSVLRPLLKATKRHKKSSPSEKTALVISTRNFYFFKVSVIYQFIWLRRTFGFLSCRQNDSNEVNRAKLKVSYYLQTILFCYLVNKTVKFFKFNSSTIFFSKKTSCNNYHS